MATWEAWAIGWSEFRCAHPAVTCEPLISGSAVY